MSTEFAAMAAQTALDQIIESAFSNSCVRSPTMIAFYRKELREEIAKGDPGAYACDTPEGGLAIAYHYIVEKRILPVRGLLALIYQILEATGGASPRSAGYEVLHYLGETIPEGGLCVSLLQDPARFARINELIWEKISEGPRGPPPVADLSEVEWDRPDGLLLHILHSGLYTLDQVLAWYAVGLTAWGMRPPVAYLKKMFDI